eukprot:6397996-Lingulodinium_polyedra.AAC.1
MQGGNQARVWQPGDGFGGRQSARRGQALRRSPMAKAARRRQAPGNGARSYQFFHSSSSSSSSASAPRLSPGLSGEQR